MMPPTLAGGFSRAPLETAQGSSGASTSRWRFSPRERQIVTLLADGCSNQEIANRLGLRLQTVKNHLSRIYRKLGVPNRVQLAVLVLKKDPPEATSE
ncbi:MAG TPA: response regulator transcription factor [Vicinamibacterales bacterium]|nr:response regulator transcription factor [Vicinamibacterales bacterium]